MMTSAFLEQEQLVMVCPRLRCSEETEMTLFTLRQQVVLL